MTVEVVDIAEGLPTSLTCVVLTHWIRVCICRSPGVDRLVPPQVVVVLELLATDGTDVGDASRPGRGLHRYRFFIEGSSVHRRGRLGYVLCGWGLRGIRMHWYEFRLEAPFHLVLGGSILEKKIAPSSIHFATKTMKTIKPAK